MRERAAFAELLRQHEELTQRFAQLLHDDAGQILTAIALQLSALEGVDAEELASLTGTLDELLERFRNAQAQLGAAVVRKRGLAAGLSQMARARGDLRVDGNPGPNWEPSTALGAFRIIEAVAPRRVVLSPAAVLCEGGQPAGDYAQILAETSGLALREGPEPNTIRIEHANQGSNR